MLFRLYGIFLSVKIPTTSCEVTLVTSHNKSVAEIKEYPSRACTTGVISRRRSSPKDLYVIEVLTQGRR